MKKIKVLSDLRALIESIERGHAEIKKYSYQFDNYEYEYGSEDDDVEEFRICAKRTTLPDDY